MAIPSWTVSAALHVAGAAVLLFFTPTEELPIPKLAVTPLDLAPPRRTLAAPPARKAMSGGGGAGDLKPASRGKLPRIAPLVFVQPAAKPAQIDPALALAPAIVDAPPVQVAAVHIGDPFGVPGPPSNGRGKNGGIGDGDGGGVGNRKGPRAGDGDGLEGVYTLGAISNAPILVHKVEPEYSDEARRARFNGSVLLRLVIDANGLPTRLEVLRSPGLGLEERALRSVAQWRFRPGTRDGKAVPVWATVEVNFSLL